MLIKIQDLSFQTIIGLLPFEREVPQKVVIQCYLQYDYEEAIFLDYAIVREYLIRTMQKEKFKKLEDAIEFLIIGLKNLFPFIQSLFMEIQKPDIFMDCVVSVCCEKKFSKDSF
ncbi:hypothetical protein CCZ01_08210 [Helicobacter monodelphidis]|uniref:dihydroneopterin aldolase n=1 Tax=Helicobacter sp. 15-1451 TaxID=2004995 RepID=UPI000DCD009A|nr:dihydroneopterin aldolase [Helicobacter sp. 15-1451]RAX56831.1 hypothetical protein CCZ01_08210 [Helicobacter sp. 15-1451]